jgi:predicted metal-dependent peptidase
MRYVKEKNIKPEAIIMLTDGYVGEWGNEWDSPLLWVVVRNKSAIAPVGKTIHIKE